MIRAELVDSSQYTGRNQRIRSITSRLEEFPVAWIGIDTPVFAGYVRALCLPNPICDLIIGNSPGVHPEILWNSGRNTTRKGDFEVKTSTYNESEGNTRIDPYANAIGVREEAVKKLPVNEEIEVIGGAVQTREGRVREMHPTDPRKP